MDASNIRVDIVSIHIVEKMEWILSTWLFFMVWLFLGLFLKVDAETDAIIKKITLLLIGIALSVAVLQTFLYAKTRVVEGFQDMQTIRTRWQKMSSPIQETCSFKGEISAKIMKMEKKSGLSDQQARERVEATFKTNKQLPCHLLESMKRAKTDAELFEVLQSIPDDILITTEEHAKACLTVLQAQIKEVKKSLDMVNTPKVDAIDTFVGKICKGGEGEKRREELLKKKADDCKLAEEVDSTTLYKEAEKKITVLEAPDIIVVPNIQKHLKEAREIAKELDSFKKKAESGSIVNELKL